MTKEIAVDDMPEVKDFLAAKHRWEQLQEKHYDLFREIRAAAEDYNDTLEAADKAVKGTKSSCGPFQLMNVAETYDVPALFEILGEKEFLALGGALKTQIVPEISKEKIKQAHAVGKLPDECVDYVLKQTYRYRRVKKIELP